MGTAKLFRNGRSQAVRLPKEFRFEGQELSIRREGEAVEQAAARGRVGAGDQRQLLPEGARRGRQ